MDLDLSQFFKTKGQAQDFATRLSRVSEKMYETDFDLEKALAEQLGIQKKDALLTFLSNNGKGTNASIDLKKTFDNILTQITTIPVLSLAIAIEPDDKIMQALTDWCMLNIGKQVIFEITVNPKLIAGAMISYNGKYLDASIKPRFEQAFNGMLAKKPHTSQKPASQPTSGQ